MDFSAVSTIEIIATIIFAIAIIHTFIAKKFEDMAHHCPKGSISYHAYHFLGEVEAVFGIWAGIFMAIYFFIGGSVDAIGHDGLMHKTSEALYYLEHKLNFTEPAFVFVIMCMAATRPVIKLAEKIIVLFSNVLPFKKKRSFYISALVIGPILGSFITEPAAMTVTAIILLNSFFLGGMSTKFKYATLGLLFVNISIGGTLTNYAAPPVVMVAAKWNWGMSHMFFNFGYKSVIAIVIGSLVVSQFFRKELEGELEGVGADDGKPEPKFWKYIVHLLFLGLVVLTSHHMVVFLGLFIFFLGFTTITETYQDRIKIRESLLVGFFLGGLVTLGGLQAWWLKPIISSLGELPLFIGTTALTGITDNAALTYLAAQVEGLSDAAKYSVMAGAVAGGGLTVIANAPNPAGLSILKDSFGEEGVSPLKMLLGSLFPTILAMVLFQILV